MARRDSTENIDHRGMREIAGILLLSGAFLLLIALFSFDPNDLLANRVPANARVSNWIGFVGAYVANAFFFVFGAAAYLWPVLLFGAGFAYLIQFFASFRRRRKKAVSGPPL